MVKVAVWIVFPLRVKKPKHCSIVSNWKWQQSFFPIRSEAPVCVFTSVMSIREAMVRRVLGEKWLVIIILMPASEKVSW